MLKNIVYRSVPRGFTLIELLIVIAIIAILASVVFVALDPLKRFKDARDSSRWNDVTAVLSAIKVDQVDNGGRYLTVIEDAPVDVVYMITGVNGTIGCNMTCDAGTVESQCLYLNDLVTEGYIGKVPVSPSGAQTWTVERTGYYLMKEVNGNILVGACESENTDDISVTR